MLVNTKSCRQESMGGGVGHFEFSAVSRGRETRRQRHDDCWAGAGEEPRERREKRQAAKRLGGRCRASWHGQLGLAFVIES